MSQETKSAESVASLVERILRADAALNGTVLAKIDNPEIAKLIVDLKNEAQWAAHMLREAASRLSSPSTPDLVKRLIEKWSTDPALQVNVPYRRMATEAVELLGLSSPEGTRADRRPKHAIACPAFRHPSADCTCGARNNPNTTVEFRHFPPMEDSDIPTLLKRELMHVAVQNDTFRRISYYYLCDLWRRGKNVAR